MEKSKKALFILMMVVIASHPVYADMVWPGLVLEYRLVSWWVILLGLVIEYIFLRWYFKFGWGKAILVDFAMNLISALFGLLLIPLTGVAWGFFSDKVISQAMETFNPSRWVSLFNRFSVISLIATFLIVVFINAVLESLVVSKVFKTKVGKKGFMILCLANACSVFIALVSLFVLPPRF